MSEFSRRAWLWLGIFAGIDFQIVAVPAWGLFCYFIYWTDFASSVVPAFPLVQAVAGATFWLASEIGLVVVIAYLSKLIAKGQRLAFWIVLLVGLAVAGALGTGIWIWIFLSFI